MQAVFAGINIQSMRPAETVRFYRDAFGLPVLEGGGTVFGLPDGAQLWIWDMRRWGNSGTYHSNLVLRCRDLHALYQQILAVGFPCEPLKRAV